MDVEKAYRTWLLNAGSKNTQRAYQRAIADLREFAEKALDEVTQADAEEFAAHLRERELSAATVNARLAACSSFYKFVLTRYAPGELDGNPFAVVRRAKVQRFGKSRALSYAQTQQLLAQPDRSTEQGARDYALILFFVLTGRRASELLNLHWSDISGGDTYHWIGKRGTERTDPLPKPVWIAIKIYLQKAGRWNLIAAHHPVFTSVSTHAGSLSTEWFNRTVKRYAHEAGLSDWITTHALRHTAARLRYEAGGDVLSISLQLAHSDIRTTQIYLGSIVHQDEAWQAIYEDLSSSE